MLKVLYVDDDDDIRHIVELALGLDPDIELTVASSGAEALVELDKSGTPDIILLDVMMPIIDGPTLLGLLRKRPDTAEVPVVFMTAKTRPADVEDYHARGAIGVIMKPFDPMRLAADIRAKLEN